MDSRNRILHLKIRRYDLYSKPDVNQTTFEISTLMDPKNIKCELQKFLSVNDEKVIKIRNTDGVLVPLTFLIDSEYDTFNIDVTNISYIDKHSATLLQDAYLDAVRQKIRTLESRIAQSELVLPQLEWRRQAYMEDILNASVNKMIFLNKRFDELAPQFGAKAPETLS